MLRSFLTSFRKPVRPALERYPSRGREAEWMETRLAQALENNRELAVNFFDPASGDYFPTALHVASQLTPELRDAYRALRDRHPVLVAEAVNRPSTYTVQLMALCEDLERHHHRIHV